MIIATLDVKQAFKSECKRFRLQAAAGRGVLINERRVRSASGPLRSAMHARSSFVLLRWLAAGEIAGVASAGPRALSLDDLQEHRDLASAMCSSSAPAKAAEAARAVTVILKEIPRSMYAHALPPDRLHKPRRFSAPIRYRACHFSQTLRDIQCKLHTIERL
jgi:hypothetical protein